jgi:NAD(P)-dependent dehydrogenase (short-subunit alcohol dehydrogenase family)
MSKPYAIVTGASSGIGLELGAICAREGFDLLVAADRPEIYSSVERFREFGAGVGVVQADLSTTAGVDRLWAAAGGRPVDAMMRGDGDVVIGWKNKLQSAIANITPAGVLAEQHRRVAESGSANEGA